jgi:hypothetical protein
MALSTINLAKELKQGYSPLFLFDLLFPDGSELHVSEHELTYLGTDYEPRVISQQISAIEALSPTGIDVPPDVRLVLADADKAMTVIDQTAGFRGARITVTFVFYDFGTATFSSDSAVPFLGRCSRPEITDETLTVSASYILNLAAKMVPSFPIQPRCPKLKPRTAAQVLLKDDPDSLYFACGSGTTADCEFTKTGCAANNDPLRFGGIVYEIPPASRSREYVTGKWITDIVSDNNAAKYGDFAPIGFGTSWVDCLALGAWPEANSTRGEAVVCEGRVQSILKVTVNDELLPAATDIDGSPYRVEDVTFRYNVISRGNRTGALNTDSPWINGAPDPHGSLCVIEWCVPRKIADGGIPRIRALVQFENVAWYQAISTIVSGVVTFADNAPNTDTAGNSPFTVTISGNSNGVLNGTFGLTSWTYGPPGTVTLSGSSASGTGGYLSFPGNSSNYAWAILALLKRAGQDIADVDLASFVKASNRFKTQVTYTDLDGNSAPHDRYTCSLVIRQRRSIQEVLTGMLRACNSHLGRNVLTGKIALFSRDAIAIQQPTLPAGSNYSTAVDGGYLAYHFSEPSMIRDGGKSTFVRPARSGASIPNSVTIAFSNSERDYSGDSTRIIDSDDMNRMGQEISGSFPAEGIASLDHGKRVGATYLAEQQYGEAYEFVSTCKGVRLSVGQIIGVSNVKHGFTIQPMRLQRIAPDANYATARYTATIHDDDWYADTFGQSDDPERGDPRRNRLRRPSFAWAPYQVQPATGDPLFVTSEWSFGLQLEYQTLGNGAPQPAALITGKRPVNEPQELMPPVLASQGTTASTGGTVPGNAGSAPVYYIAVASRLNGMPGPISAPCEIAVAQAGNTNTITAAVRFWDAASSGHFIFAGRHPMRLTSLNDAGYTGNPSTVTVTAIPEATWGSPDTEFDVLEIRPKIVWHAGVWGNDIDGIATRAITIGGAAWTTNQWAGYDCMVSSKADLSALPLLHYRVASNTATVLTIHASSPDPNAAGVSIGDVLVMLSKPSVSSLTLTDSLWMNTLSNAGAGLTTNEEKGRILRIIAGTGRGYKYTIASNTATAVTITGAWVVTPDSTSRYIIEDAGPLAGIESTPQGNADPQATMELSLPVANYAGKVLLFEAVTMDGGGNESSPFLSPLRMIYVPGAQGTRIIAASTAGGMLATDRTLKFDTSAVTQPAATTLNGAITSSQTNVTLTSGVNAVDGTVIECGSERMYIESGGGTAALTVTRGFGGTTAASHSTGAAVTLPGALTWTILAFATLPNQDFLFSKTSTDINYVDLIPSGTDELPDGETHHILADNSASYGTYGLNIPAA